MFVDSFHGEIDALKIIASDSWTHRIIARSSSPSVVFEQNLGAKQLNHFTFEIRAERSFTICGFKVYNKCEEKILSCGLPGRPVNGLINGRKFEESESFPAGTEVQFSCVESHQSLEGNAVRTCTEDGTWSGLRPWCGKIIF